MNIDIQHHSALAGGIFGFMGAVIGKTLFLVEQASVFSWQTVGSTFIMGMVGAAGGIVLTSIYKWIKKILKRER